MTLSIGLGLGAGMAVAGGGGPPAFAPTDVSGLLLWVDPSDLTTITESGGLVSQLDDKSGNANHMEQATGSMQPDTGTVTINGLNALAFDGADDRLDTDGNPFGANVVDALVLILYRVNAVANSKLFSLTGDAASSTTWHAACPFGDGNVYFDTNDGGGAIRADGATGFSTGEVHLVGFYGTSTDNEQEVWIDGVLLDAAGSGQSVPTTSKGVMIGGISGSTYTHMDLCEMIVVDGTVSESDRQKLEGYLAHKWGQEGSLPGGHPYKSEAP